MSDEEKKPLHPETNFLPPLDMVLTFFNKKFRKQKQQTSAEQQKVNEKDVEKLIEKLSEKEEE